MRDKIRKGNDVLSIKKRLFLIWEFYADQNLSLYGKTFYVGENLSAHKCVMLGGIIGDSYKIAFFECVAKAFVVISWTIS